MCCARRASPTVRPRKSTRPFSTRASICVRSERCTASWPRIGRSGSAGLSAATRTIRSPRWWPARLGEVWSWDITRLLGPEKWQYYVTGWMVADRETAGLGGRLIEESCLKRYVAREIYRVLTAPSPT